MAAPNGLPLVWLALDNDHLEAAKVLALAGCPLETTPILLYSFLSAPAYDSFPDWATTELLTRDAFVATVLCATVKDLEQLHQPPQGTHQRNLWPTLRGDAHVPARMLIADFLGVRRGPQACMLRRAVELLSPIRRHRQARRTRLAQMAGTLNRSRHLQPDSNWALTASLTHYDNYDGLAAIVRATIPGGLTNPLTLNLGDA